MTPSQLMTGQHQKYQDPESTDYPIVVFWVGTDGELWIGSCESEARYQTWLHGTPLGNEETIDNSDADEMAALLNLI